MNRLVLVIVALIGIGGAWVWVNTNAKEKPNEEAAAVLSIEDALPGRWRSYEDENSIVVFEEDGTTIDIYAGEEMGRGTWELYSDQDTAEAASMNRLRTTIDGQTYEYEIIVADEEWLSLSYLARGNTLQYRRMDE